MCSSDLIHRASHAGCSLALLCSLWLGPVSKAALPEPGTRFLTTEEVVQAAHRGDGLCLLLGCGESTLAARLAEKRGLLIHSVEPDAAKVVAARELLLDRDLYGQATVMRWDGPTLPYADNLANLVVCPSLGAFSDSEILRVLAPRGTAYILAGNTWRPVVKPWPANMDEWAHARHGADGNMVSHDTAVAAPTSLRWVNGPAQNAEGSKWYHDHSMISAQGRNFYLLDQEIVARDAFNGVLLWSKPFKPASYKERGVPVPAFLQKKVKPALRTTKVKPVAVGGYLYVATEGKLLALDARTGQTVQELAAVPSPRELAVDRDRIFVAHEAGVFALDLASRKRLWEYNSPTFHVLAADDAIICLGQGVMAAMDPATGRQRWLTQGVPVDADVTCAAHYGVVSLERSSWRDDPLGCAVLVYSTANGRMLWWRAYPPGMTHYQEARSFFAGGLLWLQMEGGTISGFDPQTGKPRQEWSSHGYHCAAPVATERFFLAPECDFTDLASGTRTQARMFKSACRLPFIPANGLLYSFPVQCECYPMLRGYMALSADGPLRPPGSPRLEKGPAYGLMPRPTLDGDGTEAWPMYRRDALRSGTTPAKLRLGALSPVWTNQVARPCSTPLAEDWRDDPFVKGLLTPPVAAEGLVLVAAPDEHRLIALDAPTGQQRWDFIADGRIDLPPTVHQGLALFGSHDGWVYCVDVKTGQLAWRFRAAPTRKLISAYGQLESAWPVPGSVLVQGDIAYFAAGRHPRNEDGVHVIALKARTGEWVWEKILNDVGLKGWYSPMLPNKKKVGLDFEPVDLLVSDGQDIAMSRWRFKPANGDYQLQIASTEYQAGRVAVPRGLWGYGIRQNKMVDPKPPIVFDQTQLRQGTTNDTAILLAAGTLVRATTAGTIAVDNRWLKLNAPVVRDGLIVAYGRIFASTRDGQVLCVQ